ncbi:hypothetical protein [Parendozoicomonas haliclonae]|uniref:Uncharacterized protein n=1 Tax=Parendozoicomonas haliclonae TaxID=1960125 RepID=A0A1X7AQ60_9GAMM|nr:hypothetical protein [Parendozoicomonas haliclonae]SMA50461.1 hypothetical protein EHSB41UT_04272 [Parendozoicomonas haliclonae]
MHKSSLAGRKRGTSTRPPLEDTEQGRVTKKAKHSFMSKKVSGCLNKIIMVGNSAHILQAANYACGRSHQPQKPVYAISPSTKVFPEVVSHCGSYSVTPVGCFPRTLIQMGREKIAKERVAPISPETDHICMVFNPAQYFTRSLAREVMQTVRDQNPDNKVQLSILLANPDCAHELRPHSKTLTELESVAHSEFQEKPSQYHHVKESMPNNAGETHLLLGPFSHPNLYAQTQAQAFEQTSAFFRGEKTAPVLRTPPKRGLAKLLETVGVDKLVSYAKQGTGALVSGTSKLLGSWYEDAPIGLHSLEKPLEKPLDNPDQEKEEEIDKEKASAPYLRRLRTEALL